MQNFEAEDEVWSGLIKVIEIAYNNDQKIIIYLFIYLWSCTIISGKAHCS